MQTPGLYADVEDDEQVQALQSSGHSLDSYSDG